MDWKLALKIGGPSALATWLFYSLIIKYLESSDIFKSNIYLNIIVLIIIFLFCSWMGWLLRKRNTPTKSVDNSLEGNEISSNDIGANLEVGSNTKNIKDNKIKNNKIGGNLTIK